MGAVAAGDGAPARAENAKAAPVSHIVRSRINPNTSPQGLLLVSSLGLIHSLVFVLGVRSTRNSGQGKSNLTMVAECRENVTCHLRGSSLQWVAGRFKSG